MARFPLNILLLAVGHHEMLSAMEIIGLSCLLIECIWDTLGETVIKMLAVQSLLIQDLSIELLLSEYVSAILYWIEHLYLAFC